MFGVGISKKAPVSTKAEDLLPYDKPAGTVYWTDKPDGEAVLQFAKKGIASEKSTKPITTHSLFLQAVKKHGNKVALLVEPSQPLVDGKAPPPLPREKWDTWTYQEYYGEARAIAKAIIKLGMEPHDAVSVFGFNSPQWFIAQWGAQFAGGKVAGIYPSDTPAQVQFKVNHSNAAVAAVESAAELSKFAKVVDQLPYLKAIITWSHDNKGVNLTRSDGSVVRVLSWNEAIALGEGESEAALDKRIEGQKASHACALIYTSGTTGNPKAVMISHDNIIAGVSAILLQGIEMVGNSGVERILSYLPLSHVAGMMVDIVCSVALTAIRKGWFEVYFARPYDLKAGSLGDRLRFVKPTVFLGVPRVWEKIAEKMKAIGAKTTGNKKKIAAWAKAKGLRYQENRQVGGSGAKPFNYGLANKLVLSKVKMALGLEHCKFGFTGAAPISYETQSYFGSLGININEVYGMSECCGATTWSTESCHQWGSVGYALPGYELKAFKVDASGKKVECPPAKDIRHPTEEEQGELCYRGRHIMMGYMANPRLGEEHVKEIQKKNAEAIDDEGWLHSGDKGCVSTLGMVRITGRYKELIIGAGGENIAPVPIEDYLKAVCPAISNAMMVGDKRKFNVVLLTLKAVGATGELAGGDELDVLARNVCSEGVTTIPQAMRDDKLIKAITEAIKATNANGEVCPSSASAIQKFTILPRDFSVDTNELTATLKLKRSVTEEKNSKILDKMYDANDTYVPYE